MDNTERTVANVIERQLAFIAISSYDHTCASHLYTLESISILIAKFVSSLSDISQNHFIKLLKFHLSAIQYICIILCSHRFLILVYFKYFE